MSTVTLPTEFLVHVAELLDRLGIPYHVGGSVASPAPSREQLDAAYLDRWAGELGIADLLDRARREVADL
jgi:hypothetical protein